MFSFTSPGPHKLIVGFSNFFIWVSSVIVVGITGHFLKEYPHDQHLTFEIVISALVLGLWLPSFALPFFSSYRFYYCAPNFIFSYLWLTAFVFAAQDYNESDCELNAPTFGSCNLKLTSEAFIFLALFFSIVSFLVDLCAWKRKCVDEAAPAHPEKDVRPSAETA